MVEEDLVECVIGLGPNLFYNSPMEACLLITTTNKSADKKGKILFINAVNEVKQDKTMSYLMESHITKIFSAYKKFETIESFASLVTNEDVLGRNGNMAINLYVRPEEHNAADTVSFADAYANWNSTSEALKTSINELFEVLQR